MVPLVECPTRNRRLQTGNHYLMSVVVRVCPRWQWRVAVAEGKRAVCSVRGDEGLVTDPFVRGRGYKI